LANNYPRLLRLSLVANLLLALFCAALAYAASRYYERSLRASLAAHVTTAGSAASEIWFLGDSRVQEWAEFDEFGAYYIGLPGATSWQVRNYLDTADLDEYANKRVVLQFGVNDFRILGYRPDEAEEIEASVFQNTQHVATALSRVASEVMLLTVLPVDAPGLPRSLVWSAEIGEAIADLNNNLMQEPPAARVTVLDASAWLDSSQEELFRDALHLKSTAYAQLNSGLRSRLDDAL